ncbi:MAG: hypothetical protein EBV02_04640 [Actinobacteria bacterium]|nr:hypothetical protein [Actinomycetota bacterium]
MAVNNIWVFAQGANGTPTTFTLELLTKARSLTTNVSAFVAGDGASLAAELGKYGATKVYSTGDLGGRLFNMHRSDLRCAGRAGIGHGYCHHLRGCAV